jgi:hypothetical protein
MEKRNLKWLGILAVVLVIAAVMNRDGFDRGGTISVGSFGSKGESGMAPGMPSQAPMADDFAEDTAYVSGKRAMMIEPEPPSYPSAGLTAAEVDQKIIKNGYVSMIVDRVSEASAKIVGLAIGKGGFVQSSSVSERGDGTHFGAVTVRVPAKEFESLTMEIKSLANVVKNETATGQDVTEQFTDLQAQLKNAQAQEEEYLKILKRAQTVSDILQVQSYLGGIRSTIESLQGRLKYLENVTSYSTISVTLEEDAAIKVPTKDFRPVATLKEAGRALVAYFQSAVSAVIWIVIVGGGLGIPALVVLWIIMRLVKKYRGPARI